MTAQLIAVDANALDLVLRKLDHLERKFDAADIRPRSEWVSIAEYAGTKGVTTRTVQNWIASGRVKARGAGKMREVKV